MTNTPSPFTSSRLKVFFALLAGISTLLIMGCGTDEGLGGSSTISFTAKHHAKAIPYTSVYIKYGAETSPGVNATDFDAAVAADSEGKGQFPNLQKGDYYLYGVGYDSAISQVVTGGVPVKIKKDGDQMDVTVAITED